MSLRQKMEGVYNLLEKTKSVRDRFSEVINIFVTISNMLFRPFVAIGIVTVMAQTGVLAKAPLVTGTIIPILAIGYAIHPFVKAVRGS